MPSNDLPLAEERPPSRRRLRRLLRTGWRVSKHARRPCSPSHERRAGFGDKGEFRNRGVQRLRRLRQSAREEVPAAALGCELSILDDDAAAAQYRDRPTAQPAAFIGSITNVIVQHAGAD